MALRIYLVQVFFIVTLIYSQDLKIPPADSIDYDFVVSNPYRAVMTIKENLKQTEKQENQKQAGHLYSMLGLAYYFLGRYDESAAAYLHALSIFESLRDYRELAINYGEFGYQLKKNDLMKSDLYMRKALAIAEEHQLDDEIKRKLWNNYGVIKELNKEYDSAMYYYTLALESKKKAKDEYGLPYSLNNIAALLIQQNRFNDAKSYLRLSDQYRSEETNPYGRADNLILWGDLYYQSGAMDSAVRAYQEALTIAEKNRYSYLQEYCLKKISESAEKRADWSTAYAYFKRFYQIREENENEKVRNTIAQLEIAYDTERKNILLTLKDYEIRRYRLWIVIGGITVIFAAILALTWFSFRKKREEQEKRIREAELKKTFAEEKLKISRELHDNVGARLSYLISALDYAGENLSSVNEEKIHHWLEFSRETLGDLRDAVWTIKMEEGKPEDLIYRIRQYISHLALPKEKMAFHIEVTGNLQFPLTSLQMLNLFRIVQEALQNSIKYSQGNAIHIEFREESEHFVLTVRDNGKGFDVNNYIPGNGIENMRTRCEETGGEFRINSSSQGTIVRCLLKK